MKTASIMNSSSACAATQNQSGVQICLGSMEWMDVKKESLIIDNMVATLYNRIESKHRNLIDFCAFLTHGGNKWKR